MRNKAFKIFIATLVFAVVGAVSACAATIEITGLQEIDVEKGTVQVTFAATDMADSDQLTTLVYNKDAGEIPVDANIVYINQDEYGTYSGTLAFKMKDGVEIGTNCRLLIGGEGVATAAYYDFSYQNYTLGRMVSGTISGVTLTETDPELLEMMFGAKAGTYGFTVNLKNADQTRILQSARITYNNAAGTFIYAFPEKVQEGNYVVQIYKPGFLVRNFAITVGSADLIIADRDLKYGDVVADLDVNTKDVTEIISAFGADIEIASNRGKAYKAEYDYNGDCRVDTREVGNIITAFQTGYDIEVYGEDQSIDISDLVIE